MTQSAYATRAEVDAYFADIYSTTPSGWSTATTSAKDAALKVASRWLDITFGKRWQGTRTQTAIDSGLDWPRLGVVALDGYSISSTEVPEAIKQACAEAAALHLQGNLDSLPDRIDSTERIVSKTLTAGAVSKSVTYSGAVASDATQMRRWPRIEGILRHLLGGDDTVEMGVTL